MSSWREIGLVADMEESTMCAHSIGSKDLVLMRVGETVYCYEDRCSHQDLRLSEFGALRKDLLVCHAHGARFRLTDGCPVWGAATCPLRRYAVRVTNGRIFVDVES